MPKEDKKAKRTKKKESPVKVIRTTNDQELSDEELRGVTGGVGKRVTFGSP